MTADIAILEIFGYNVKKYIILECGNMRKLGFLLTLLLVFVLAGCSGQNGNSVSSTTLSSGTTTITYTKATSAITTQALTSSTKLSSQKNTTVKVAEQKNTTTKTTEKKATKTSKTVYVTPTGKKYHYNGNCNGGTYTLDTLDNALKRNLTPCKKCVL